VTDDIRADFSTSCDTWVLYSRWQLLSLIWLTCGLETRVDWIMSNNFIDKLWFLGRNMRSPSGVQRVVVINRETGEELVSQPIPNGGNWALCGFVNWRRFPLPYGVLTENHIESMDIHIKQDNGDWSGENVVVWLTKSSSRMPLGMWHCHSSELTSGQHCVLSMDNPHRIEEIQRIDLLVETSTNQSWWWSGDPKEFMFVVTTIERGLVLSEIFACGAGQRMAHKETALFRFTLPALLDYSDFLKSGKMLIKAKGESRWHPRHIIVLGISAGNTEDVRILGGDLNINNLRLTTEGYQGDKSLYEIPRW
jgi:hypothetical protein